MSTTPNNGPLGSPTAKPTGGTIVSRTRDFSYLPDLAPEQASRLSELTDDIQDTINDAAKIIYALGHKLIAAREIVSHGHWGIYLQNEFQWSATTARNWINVTENIPPEKLGSVEIAQKVLYQIAAPSTPDDVRAQLLDRAAAGESLTPEDVRTARAAAGPLIIIQRHDGQRRTITTASGITINVYTSAFSGRWSADLATPDGIKFNTLNMPAAHSRHEAVQKVIALFYHGPIHTRRVFALNNGSRITIMYRPVESDWFRFEAEINTPEGITLKGYGSPRHAAMSNLKQRLRDYIGFSRRVDDLATGQQPDPIGTLTSDDADDLFPIGTYVTVMSENGFGVHRIGIVRDYLDETNLYAVEAWDTNSSNHKLESLPVSRLKIADDWDHEHIWLYSTRQSKEELLLIGWKDHYISFDWNNDINQHRYNFAYPTPRFPDDKGLAVRLSPQYVDYFVANGGTIQIFDDLELLDDRMKAIATKAGRARGGEMLYPPENEPENNESDDLPDEPLIDGIFEALDESDQSKVGLVRWFRVNKDRHVRSDELDQAITQMLDDGDIVKNNTPPGAIVTYKLNGHSERSGIRKPTLEDDRAALFRVLDTRRRDVFYLGELSRWSGINNLDRTRAAVASMTEVLVEDVDANQRTLYRRLDLINPPPATDGSLPSANDIFSVATDRNHAVNVNDLVEHYHLTPGNLGELLNVIHADHRMVIDGQTLYTNQHPYWERLRQQDRTPAVVPVEVPGQRALRDEVKQLRATKAAGDMVVLLDHIESALSTAMADILTGQLADLQFADQALRDKIQTRIVEHKQQLDAFRAELTRLATAVSVRGPHADLSFAESLDQADHDTQTQIGDQSAIDKGIAAAESVAVFDIPESRHSLPEQSAS